MYQFLRLFVFASQIAFAGLVEAPDYTTALKEASQSGKKIVVYYNTEHAELVDATPVEIFEGKTLKDEATINRLNANYVYLPIKSGAAGPEKELVKELKGKEGFTILGPTPAEDAVKIVSIGNYRFGKFWMKPWELESFHSILDLMDKNLSYAQLRVLDFTRNRVGMRVGGGDCSALGKAAFSKTGSKKTSVSLKGKKFMETVQPGDEVWIRPGSSYRTSRGVSSTSTGHYFIAGVHPAKGGVEMYHQNWNSGNANGKKVRRDVFYQFLSGGGNIYRPKSR